MVYKVLKMNYWAKNIANYVYNHCKKFESFVAIILWFVLDKIRGVKCWWGAGPQTFDLVLYVYSLKTVPPNICARLSSTGNCPA